MILTNKTYDTLKWIARYLLPGLGTLYFALSSIWNLPYSKEVIGTLSALSVFLGGLLGLSTMQYRQDRYSAGDTSFFSNSSLVDARVSSLNMSDKTYETLKWVALMLLPGLGTLYMVLSGFWGFPYGEQVVGTISAITIFVQVLLGVSSSQIGKSKKVVDDSPL